MPIEVVEIDDSKSFQEAKGTESLPGFDKLPQIEDQQLNQSHRNADNSGRSRPNDYKTFLFSMNPHFVDPTVLPSYSVHSSD